MENLVVGTLNNKRQVVRRGGWVCSGRFLVEIERLELIKVDQHAVRRELYANRPAMRQA